MRVLTKTYQGSQQSLDISWSEKVCLDTGTGGCVKSAGCHKLCFSSSLSSHTAHCRLTTSSRRTSRQTLRYRLSGV